MKKNLLLTLSLCVLTTAGFSQKENDYWVFGDKAGLDFSSGNPVPVLTSMVSSEGSAAVCDPLTGKLLFYSNGEKVWNRNNQVMPNGSGLKGNAPLFGDNTTAQGVCIVPVIGSIQRYYLFSLEPEAGEVFRNSNGYLYYSIVDMSLNGGLGDIDPNYKNIALDSFLSEAMTAVPGGNCNDIWLLTHATDTALVKAFHITESGIAKTPVISNTGKEIDGKGSFQTSQFAISPDSRKLAILSSNVLWYGLPSTFFNPNSSPNGSMVCTFDPISGKVTDPIILNSNLSNPYDQYLNNSICFSPNSRKLYLLASNRALGDIDFVDTLWQYDLDSFTQAGVKASRTLIEGNNVTNAFSPMQRNKDKIYLAPSDDNGYLNVIEEPNATGIACKYKKRAIQLKTGSASIYSLPVLVSFPVKSDSAYSALDSVVCSGWEEGIVLSGPEAEDELGYRYRWNTGDTSMRYTIHTDGTYWINYYNTCHYRVDTLRLKAVTLDPLINIDKTILGTTKSYKQYQWLLNGEIIPDATQSKHTIVVNGDYRVIVWDENGCSDTSDIFKVDNYTGIDDLSDLARQIAVYPNPIQDRLFIQSPKAVHIMLSSIDGKVLLKSFNESSVSVKHLVPGIYMLNISNQDGVILRTEKIIKAL